MKSTGASTTTTGKRGQRSVNTLTRRAFLAQLRMTVQRQLAEIDAAEGSIYPSMNAQGDSQDQAPWVDDLIKK